ncbi:MAG: hypothetical protein IJ120_13415 [Solobacterium sp.]|nr:hypothetical protein [Solobacterium sp.]
MPEHSYREIRLKNNTKEKRKLIIEFQEEGYELLEEFLETEINTFRKAVLNEITAVLNGEKEDSKFAGNRFSLAIMPGVTIIYDDKDEDFQWCQVDTEELYELINEWHERWQEMKSHE